jgi:hypothetical protein
LAVSGRGVSMMLVRMTTLVGLVGLCLSVALPTQAAAAAEAIGVPDAPANVEKVAPGPQSAGVPDAPAGVERTLARQAFDFPNGFVAPDGRRFPGGSYDLALIDFGGRYYLKLTHRETSEGLRVAARPVLSATDAAGPETPGTRVSLRRADGGASLHFTHGKITAAFPLRGAGKTS